MTNPSVWESGRELVRDGDVVAAVTLVEGWLKGRLDSPLRIKVDRWLRALLLRAQDANLLKSRARDRLITSEAEAVELRVISLSLLELIDEIEKTDLSTSIPEPPISNIPPNYAQGNFEKITGSRSHLQMASWLEQGVICSSAVCRLALGLKFGSGFRVKGGLICTNNHVIRDADAAARFTAEFFFEERLDGTMKETIKLPLDPKRFWTSSELDVSLVGANFEGLDGTVAILDFLPAASIRVGDTVSIIQHPLGGPKRIATTANEVINIFDHRIQYLTDTLPGSSGSPVFNDLWQVIAVHHAGGDLLKSAAGDKVFANEGIAATAFAALPEVKKLMEG